MDVVNIWNFGDNSLLQWSHPFVLERFLLCKHGSRFYFHHCWHDTNGPSQGSNSFLDRNHNSSNHLIQSRFQNHQHSHFLFWVFHKVDMTIKWYRDWITIVGYKRLMCRTGQSHSQLHWLFVDCLYLISASLGKSNANEK